LKDLQVLAPRKRRFPHAPPRESSAVQKQADLVYKSILDQQLACYHEGFDMSKPPHANGHNGHMARLEDEVMALVELGRGLLSIPDQEAVREDA